jgi:hypothetical protein
MSIAFQNTGRVALVRDITQHAGNLAVPHFVVHLSRKLEVVALVVDRPRPAVLDDDAPVGGRDDVVERDVALAGKQRDVRHALKLHGVPRLGERTSVRAPDTRQAFDPFRLFARGLVVLEHALLDDEPLIGRHPLIVPGHARERAFLRAVGLHVHELRAVAQLADRLVGRGDEARARVVGLLANRAVQLCRVADRFVNGQPEVCRVEDEVVLTGLDALRREPLGRDRRPALGVARNVERLDVLPALSRWRRFVLVGLEISRCGGGGAEIRDRRG